MTQNTCLVRIQLIVRTLELNIAKRQCFLYKTMVMPCLACGGLKRFIKYKHSVLLIYRTMLMHFSFVYCWYFKTILISQHGPVRPFNRMSVVWAKKVVLLTLKIIIFSLQISCNLLFEITYQWGAYSQLSKCCFLHNLTYKL